MFLLAAGSVAGVTLVVSIVATIALLSLEDNSRPPSTEWRTSPAQRSESPIGVDAGPDVITIPAVEDDGGIFRPPARTNFLLLGLDQHWLADAIMVGTFYRDTNEIRLMSIPRDMYTVISDERLEQFRAEGLRMPRRLKINEMRSLGGRENGIYHLMIQLSEMLGVHFHYYVEVRLAGFRRVVDAIGGVEMYIPQHLIYEDPYATPPLVINVPPGWQRLDGRMAEGVVRFRQFQSGGVGRVPRDVMQMEFMNQLIRQTLTREALLNNPQELLSVFFNEVRTNVGPMDVIRYLPFVRDVDIDNIQTFTMPGSGRLMNGTYFFVPDTQELPGLITQVFYADLLTIDE